MRDTVTARWRLFTCGLDAMIVEWDFTRLKPLAVTSSLGGAAWHMAAQQQSAQEAPGEEDEPDPLVAVATDDGAVRIHAAEPTRPSLQFRKTVGRSDARALHVAWRADGQVVFAGYSDGCISIIDVQGGTPVTILQPRFAVRRALTQDVCTATAVHGCLLKDRTLQ
jgi:WD40 repeat protein